MGNAPFRYNPTGPTRPRFISSVAVHGKQPLDIDPTKEARSPVEVAIRQTLSPRQHRAAKVETWGITGTMSCWPRPSLERDCRQTDGGRRGTYPKWILIRNGCAPMDNQAAT